MDSPNFGKFSSLTFLKVKGVWNHRIKSTPPPFENRATFSVQEPLRCLPTRGFIFVGKGNY